MVALCCEPGSRLPKIALVSVPAYVHGEPSKSSSYSSIAEPWLSGWTHSIISVVDSERPVGTVPSLI